MATRANAVTSTPTNRLDLARQKFNVIERMARLRRDNYIEEADMERIPSAIPTNSEEFTAFMQQLFQFGLKKHMPGCPIRVNNNVLSLRLDGVQYRQAKEVRSLFDKAGIRNYIADKNRELYQVMEQNSSEHLRNSGYVEYKEEQDRQFYHVMYRSQDVNYSGMQSLYQAITLQGRSDSALSAQYSAITALVQERNEVRRREFIQNRTNLNAQFIQHAVAALTIPVEHLSPELQTALREAGIEVFIKKPVITDLVSTDVMVDVFSAPNEEDETWRILPVVPEIIETNEERVYHGQGTITAYDPTSQASKNGTLPYVIQHCLRAGANVVDFVAVLPEEFRANLMKCNEIYEQVMGQSSEGLNKGDLARAYGESLRATREQQAQEAILETPVSESAERATIEVGSRKMPDIDIDFVETPSGLSTADLDRLVAEAFGRQVPEQEAVQQAQSSVVDALTQQLRAQLDQQGERRTAQVYQPYEPADDDLPFEQEPAAPVEVEEVVVAETPAPSIDDLYANMMAQLAARQAPTPQEPTSSYHESYGSNPIFIHAGEANAIQSYMAFRGQEGRQFANFNEACIYTGQPVGQIVMYNYLNRHREANADDVVWVANFDGSLF